MTYIQVTVGVLNVELCNCDICIGCSFIFISFILQPINPYKVLQPKDIDLVTY